MPTEWIQMLFLNTSSWYFVFTFTSYLQIELWFLQKLSDLFPHQYLSSYQQI